jgi:cardiolipin synthase
MGRSAGSASRSLLTVPNLLTLSRVPLAGLVWLRPQDPVFVLGLMALAAVTDVMDGWLERRIQKRRGQTSDRAGSIGTWLDPVCDKIFMLSLLTAITVAHDLPLWIIPLIAAREILQTAIVGATRVFPPLGRRLRPRFRANVLGKATTVIQFLTVGAILLKIPGQFSLALASGVIGGIAVGVYVLRALNPAERQSPA